MAHGLLFISYIIMAIMLKYEENWTGKKFGIVAMASIIPFGTFYVEKKYLRNKIDKSSTINGLPHFDLEISEIPTEKRISK